MFSDITSKVIRNWIESISGLKRAKNMYPILIKKMFDDGCTEYNDYDNNFIRIKNQPFRAVKIPGIEPAAKRYADPDTVRRILSVASVYPLDILARDVAMLVLCLAGINAIDLYGMSTDCLQDGYLCYNRSKTKYSRSDKAYFRIRVPEIILPLLKKYRGHGSLFNFSETYADPDIFSTQVNKGLKRLCSGAGVPKITVYWLRHTWATIARNFCGCSIEDVAFCLNHTSAHRVTEDYIEKSFDLVDEVNEKVLKVIFP
jgi:integrase